MKSSNCVSLACNIHLCRDQISSIGDLSFIHYLGNSIKLCPFCSNPSAEVLHWAMQGVHLTDMETVLAKLPLFTPLSKHTDSFFLNVVSAESIP